MRLKDKTSPRVTSDPGLFIFIDPPQTGRPFPLRTRNICDCKSVLTVKIKGDIIKSGETLMTNHRVNIADDEPPCEKRMVVF